MTSLPSTASTSISLRPATSRDIPALTEIYNHEIIHTSSLFNYDPVTEADRLKWLETTQAGGYPVLVAVYRDADRGEDRSENGERTVGFCSLGALIAKAGYRKSAEISLYLHKDFRGRGLGKILYEAILEEARKKDIHAIFAYVCTENVPSCRFWEKFGWEKYGVQREVGWKFDRWLDVACYQKIIN